MQGQQNIKALVWSKKVFVFVFTDALIRIICDKRQFAFGKGS